tara:strand:+ start:43 stop:576 length:534 start_codon:yes stop_codon:yes gene_type:complete
MKITCEICGRGFQDSTKYKAKYALAQHNKSCIRLFKKKQLRDCKHWLNNIATERDINRLYNYIQNPSQDGLYVDVTPTKQEPEQSSPEPLSDDENCFYEKEYLHDESSSESDRSCNSSPETEGLSLSKPLNLKLWIDEKSNIEYYIDENNKIYNKINRVHIGKKIIMPNNKYKLELY